ncbi:hypothetical protein [Abyssibius alkaniclasticus]|uniref:hypothetical protein n=1 Tax=Abyssibius alkaniclasticus TaxID=2881234 RepID=UPI004059C60B
MAKASIEKAFAKDTDTDQALVEKIDALEKSLEREQDGRREDRFVCLLIVFMLLDILLLNGAVNMSVGIIVFVLQLVFLLVVAKRMGVEQIAGILDRILNTFAKRGPE